MALGHGYVARFVEGLPKKHFRRAAPPPSGSGWLAGRMAPTIATLTRRQIVGPLPVCMRACVRVRAHGDRLRACVRMCVRMRVSPTQEACLCYS